MKFRHVYHKTDDVLEDIKKLGTLGPDQDLSLLTLDIKDFYMEGEHDDLVTNSFTHILDPPKKDKFRRSLDRSTVSSIRVNTII